MSSGGGESAFDRVETLQIGDHPTDIVYHSFANKSFLLITQRQKVRFHDRFSAKNNNHG